MSKIKPLILATTTVALIASLAGCSIPEKGPTAPLDLTGTTAPSAPATSSGTPEDPAEAAVSSDVQTIRATYNIFLTGIFSIDPEEFTTYTQSYSDLTSESAELEKKEAIKALTALAPSAFGNIDTSGYTLDQQGALYSTFAYLGAMSNTGGSEIKVEFPDDAVIVTGDTATIDITKVSVTVNGVAADTSTAGQGANFVKKSGRWFISIPPELLEQ